MEINGFKEWLQEQEIKPVIYRPGAIISTKVCHRRGGGPERMNPFKVQNPSKSVHMQYKSSGNSNIVNR